MSDVQIKYILRFDDICPTMNWQVWNQIEKLLDKYSIKPLLAIIPDCQDETMRFEAADMQFWTKVRDWQAKGYDIALHGYSHVYTNKKPGIVGITRQSEFVGLDEEKQTEKIANGLKILGENGVKTDIWIAPSHSFDYTTIKVLKAHGITYISDGFGESLFQFKGMTWVPCQIWGRILPVKRSGIYTVCYHHSTWTEFDLKNFESDLMHFHNLITSFANVVDTFPIIEGRPVRHICEVYKRKLKNLVKTVLLR